MSLYTGVPVVSCNLVNTEGVATLVSVGDTLTNVEWDGAYENPIVSGTVLGFTVRQKMRQHTGHVPIFDGVPTVSVADPDTCRSDHDIAANFVVDTITVEDERGMHVQIPVGRILSLTVTPADEDAEEDETPDWGLIVPAPLHDNNEVDPIPDDALTPEDYGVSVAARVNGGAFRVAITGTMVPHHENGEGKDGAWVGIGLIAPDDATSVKYATAASVSDLSRAKMTELTTLETIGDQGKGLAYYVNKCDNSAKLALRVQWGTTGSDPEPIDYLLDLSGVTCTK